jgi:nucleoside-diphosphate-sugar epimerase
LKVLVTGGSGFIGSHLVDALQQKHFDVIVFDELPPRFTPTVSFFRGSITNRELVRRAIRNVDAVFHLAGILGTQETIERAYTTLEVNALGTLNVLDSAREHSAAVMYVAKPNFWRNPYTVSKIAAEELSLMYRDEFGMDVRVVRCYNVYGPRQPANGCQKAIPTFITRALRGQPIPVFGDGTQGTDHIFVSDAVAAMIAVFESERAPQGVIDIGSGQEITVNEIVQIVRRLTGTTSAIEHMKMRRGEQEQTRIKADITGLLGIDFAPRVHFEEGLKKTIDYYRLLMTTPAKE